jgi:hypothetical protein
VRCVERVQVVERVVTAATRHQFFDQRAFASLPRAADYNGGHHVQALRKGFAH